MARGHKIRIGIHERKPGMDFGGPSYDRKAIECKWIFKKKTDADGNVTVYKARLVAKGFWQVQGVDYDETFSPIAMFKSIWILLAIAAFHDYEIWQMDVKTAFSMATLMKSCI
jgi:hypothetical protein